MKRYPTSEESYGLYILLAQTREALYKARGKELNKYGISPRQSAVLFIIKSIGENATPAEISRRLFRKPHSVAGILDRMEEQGLIKKSKDLERKNMIRVSITEKGEKAYSQCSKREAPSKLFSALSVRERRALESSLRKLRTAALEEIDWKEELPFP
jgi:DNA-binding MarR family transcriptional regulator